MIRWTDGGLSALAMDTALDFDGDIGSGFAGYRIF